MPTLEVHDRDLMIHRRATITFGYLKTRSFHQTDHRLTLLLCSETLNPGTMFGWQRSPVISRISGVFSVPFQSKYTKESTCCTTQYTNWNFGYLFSLVWFTVIVFAFLTACSLYFMKSVYSTLECFKLPSDVNFSYILIYTFGSLTEPEPSRKFLPRNTAGLKIHRQNIYVLFYLRTMFFTHSH